MKNEPVRILFINSEITPFLPETKISKIGRYLPQGIQETGKEIRSFMPRYGCINERRNQLHEVIRLSGMNIVINDIDRPLIIKVSSIPAARMQVYFIDNEDYFHRKYIYRDAESRYFEDNDERAIFFARGVLETVKKLRWKPDIVHCQGWITHLVPLLLKKAYNDDPIFEDAKIILSLYGDCSDMEFCSSFPDKITMPGINREDTKTLDGCKGTNLAQIAIEHSDGVIIAENGIDGEILNALKGTGVPYLDYVDTENPEYISRYNEFYDKILKNE